MAKRGTATFAPCKDEHSIEQCAVHFILRSAVKKSDMVEILDLIRSNNFFRDFFTNAKYKEVSPVDDQSPKDSLKDVVVSAVKLTRNDGTTREWEAYFNGKTFKVVCYSYTRWVHVLPVVINILNEMFSRFTKIEINAIGLSYLDIFNIKAESSDIVDVRKLFRASSPYLPRNFFSASAPLKSKIEILSGDSLKSQDAFLRECVEIGIKHGDDNYPTGYSIETTHFAIGSKNLWSYCGRKGDYEMIKSVLEKLHEHSKRSLGELLTTPALRKIGMVSEHD